MVEVNEMLGIPGVVCVGNHGLERLVEGRYEVSPKAKDYIEVVKATVDELERRLQIKGLRIENKGLTASIHYRLCLKPQLAKGKALKELEKIPELKKLRIMEGKMAINLLPQIEMNKGTATMELIRDYKLDSAIYLGDDFTDLDAFKAIKQARKDSTFQGLAIAVTDNEVAKEVVTRADLTLNGVEGVEALLALIAELKSN